MLMLLTGCNNLQLSKPTSDPIAEDIISTPDITVNRVNYKIGLDETKAVMSNDTLQIPMKLKGDESCENIGVKIFIVR